jgi:hypothetical protein
VIKFVVRLVVNSPAAILVAVVLVVVTHPAHGQLPGRQLATAASESSRLAVELQRMSADELRQERLRVELILHQLDIRAMSLAAGGAGGNVQQLRGRLQALRAVHAASAELRMRRDALKQRMAEVGCQPISDAELTKRQYEITQQLLPKSGSRCSKCGGDGWLPCNASNCCNGRYSSLLFPDADRECSNCEGTGKITCPRCSASGAILYNSRGTGIEP